MIKGVAVGLVAVVGLSTAAYVSSDETTSTCYAPRSLDQQMTIVATKLGSGVHMFTQPVEPEKVKDVTLGTWATLGAKWHAFTGAANGNPADIPAPTPCPTGGSSVCGVADPAVVATEPDGTVAAASLGSSLSGKYLAADALRKAGFPESAIPLGVAIAKYESGFNPSIANSSNHVGLWQISGPNAAHLKLGDRTDPYVNARYAKALWDGRGGTWARDWTTYNTAKQHEAEYANLSKGGGQDTPVDPSTPPAVDCSSVDATIATWNVLYTNSEANAVAGIKAIAASGAVIINGQEWSKTGVRAAATRALGPDWQETNHNTNSTPIWVNTTVFDVLSEQHPEAFGIVHVENGASGTVLGPRQISEVTVRRKSTGQVFSMINTHMMPDSDGKPKRIAVFRDHIRKVVAETQRLSAQGPVILAGDWNQKVGDPLLQPLIDAGCTSTASTLGVKATIGKSTSYDQIYYCGTGAPSSQMLYANHGSDHRGYAATFPGAQVGASVDGGSSPADWDNLNPRTPEQAIAFLTANMPNGIPGYSVYNHCEGYMTRAYGHGGGYPTARSHWNAPGPKTPGMSDPPRGALVFWAENHVALSLGGGKIISTDYNGQTGRFQKGMVSSGNITGIDKWGQRLGWRPPTFTPGGQPA